MTAALRLLALAALCAGIAYGVAAWLDASLAPVFGALTR